MCSPFEEFIERPSYLINDLMTLEKVCVPLKFVHLGVLLFEV